MDSRGALSLCRRTVHITLPTLSPRSSASARWAQAAVRAPGHAQYWRAVVRFWRATPHHERRHAIPGSRTRCARQRTLALTDVAGWPTTSGQASAHGLADCSGLVARRRRHGPNRGAAVITRGHRCGLAHLVAWRETLQPQRRDAGRRHHARRPCARAFGHT